MDLMDFNVNQRGKKAEHTYKLVNIYRCAS